MAVGAPSKVSLFRTDGRPMPNRGVTQRQ